MFYWICKWNWCFPSTVMYKIYQMNGYGKSSNDSKYMNLLVHDKELLKKYNEIWDKISNLLKKCLIVNQCIMIGKLEIRQNLK